LGGSRAGRELSQVLDTQPTLDVADLGLPDAGDVRDQPAGVRVSDETGWSPWTVMLPSAAMVTA
jgi:hypothetical protein